MLSKSVKWLLVTLMIVSVVLVACGATPEPEPTAAPTEAAQPTSPPKETLKVAFVYVAPRSSQDLLRRRQIIQASARTCYGLPAGAKFTGIDGLNGVTVVCRRMDKALGTKYAERVENYRKFLQKNNGYFIVIQPESAY